MPETLWQCLLKRNKNPSFRDGRNETKQNHRFIIYVVFKGAEKWNPFQSHATNMKDV